MSASICNKNIKTCNLSEEKSLHVHYYFRHCKDRSVDRVTKKYILSKEVTKHPLIFKHNTISKINEVS